MKNEEKEKTIAEIKEKLAKSQVTDEEIGTELQRSFMEYAMSVIVARALPDIKDGFKPVHRRIIFAAHKLGMKQNTPYKKSARLVGEVIGKYHPHGDTAVYETIVRMAQDFSMRYTLIDGHGNFGSIDGDGAAAMRYTEVRLTKICEEFLRDIDNEVVPFVDNYDGTEQEPVILPALLPSLLMNGSSGIAVGMSTNIPTHNLGELLDASIALMKNPQLTPIDLMQYIPGPDFPTGAYIIGTDGIRDYFNTGKGRIIVRSKAEIIQKGDRNYIQISEIPYMINKAELVSKIAELVRDKKIEGISDIKDESNRNGIRIIIELKKDVVPEVILNQLYKNSDLQTSITVNMLGLYEGAPQIKNMKEMLQIYTDFQQTIVRRRLEFQLKQAKERAHILEGLAIALDHIDEVIATIKKSPDTNTAKTNLMTKFGLSEIQAQAILTMKLQTLTGLEKQKILDELKKLHELIADINAKLADPEKIKTIVIDQITELKNKYNDARRSIILADAIANISDESLIPQQDIIISLSQNGYLKRLPVDTYKVQNRGGVGVIGVTIHDDDDIRKIIYTNTHVDLLFFTNKGKVYKTRAYQIVEGSRTSKGQPAQNYIDIAKADPNSKDNELVLDLLPIKDYNSNDYIILCTKKGVIKKTKLSEFESIHKNGKIAISLRDGDELLSAVITNGQKEVLLSSSNGYAVRFNENDIRPMGRNASGVRGMRLGNNSVMIACNSATADDNVLVISENGLGKISQLKDYRLTKRGGKGVKTIKINDKTGNLINSLIVKGNEDLLLLTSAGKITRISLANLKILGRNTSGVKLIQVDNSKDKVVSAVVIA
ncbi:DNA gyrase subunit A [bacterium]|nr:DNA gyrase subunit A [bacterium]